MTDDTRYVFMPESDVLAAGGVVQTIRNSYWCVHPEKGLRFWQGARNREGKLVGASPQCNQSEAIAKHLKPAGDEVKLIPLVLAPINIRDYRD